MIKDKHIVAVFDPSLRARLEAIVLPHIGPYIGHGLLSDAGIGVHVDHEHARLQKMLESTFLLTVVVSGKHGEEVRTIAAAEEGEVPCGLIIFGEDKWVGESLPYLCSKYAFIHCVHDDGCSMGPAFSRLIKYPTSITSTYNFAKSGRELAGTIILEAQYARQYGRNVPPIHEREIAPIRPPYAGNTGE